MSKIIEITSCEECPHLVFMGSCTKFCALFARQEWETKDGEGEFNENKPIPSWCPLPDRKPDYKYADALDWCRSHKWCDKDIEIFNAARERK